MGSDGGLGGRAAVVGGRPARVRTAGDDPEQGDATPAGRRRPARLSLAGLAGALLFFSWTLTPSLLPRVWYLQGVQSGIGAATGYGIAVLAWWILRTARVPRPGPRWHRWVGYGLGVVACGVVPTMMIAGARWQIESRRLIGMPVDQPANYVGTLAVATGVAGALLGLARLCRVTTRTVARFLGRWVPGAPARVTAMLLVTALLLGLVEGLLTNVASRAANHVFALRDDGDEPGVARPSGRLRSGGPGSLVPWRSLGREGRVFVSAGPTPTEISQVTGAPAKRPIRVYAGRASAPGTRDRARLAVRELQRTGAFDRKVLAVATATGTGWVDSGLSDPLEYLYGGDTAEVSMQYSFLPSWLSFVADKSRSRAAGQALFDEVYRAWAERPADDRPKLVVFGESLGAFGGEAAFRGLSDLTARTDGAVWVGPPNESRLWRRFVRHRDAGTPQWRPQYADGARVRFMGRPADLARGGATWHRPRVVYLQHASDPIVWWSPDLLLHRPPWLRGPRGPDVPRAMRWYPFVTFWQVTADMVFSTDVPPGHGHRYGADTVDAWTAVAAPEGWTPARTARLRTIFEHRAVRGTGS